MSEATHQAVGASLRGWNRELRWLIAICLLVVALVIWLIARGFKEVKTPGITDKEIRIGMTSGTEGLIAPLGQDYSEGVYAAIEAANRGKGIHGRKIKLIARNDSYDPLQCVLNTRDLIGKEAVFALTSYLGTPTSVKAQPIWTGAKVPVVGFLTGARSLREPFNLYNFHIRASYWEEIHSIVNLLANDLHVKRVAVLYQYDSFGQSVRRDTQELLTQHHLSLVAEGSYPRGTLDVESSAKSILAGNPEAVILIGSAPPLAKFIRLIKASSRSPVYFAAASFVGAQTFLDSAGKDSEGCYVCHVMPMYEGANVQLLSDYRRDLALSAPGYKASSAGLEGYINGRVLVEGLQRAGRELTRTRFIRALESIRGQPFGPGYEFSYSPKNHEGSSRVYMTVIRNGKYEYLDVKN